MNSEIILDLSRLLSRVRHHAPTGVDRVEMAYARGLTDHYAQRLHFAAVHPFGNYGRLARDKVLRFLDDTERRWTSEEGTGKRPTVEILPTLLGLLPRPHRSTRPAIYVQASPHHLTRPVAVHRILQREQARFLCLVHDLIPIEYPEYARPEGAAQHRLRIETVARFADAIIVNSAATGTSLKPWLADAHRSPQVRVALLGTHQGADEARPDAGSHEPYFLCVGTIEPRKNHLLLLNLWRHMAETMAPDAVPRLVIVGRRGWENEQVIDMLERCPALQGRVEELNGCPDLRMEALLRGARALLLPSFAEGYGMPVAEALLAGTPVICSDLPALREAGGDAPDFLDPLDGPEWQAHILDHAQAGPLYRAQIARLARWHAPTWRSHFRIVCDVIEELER